MIHWAVGWPAEAVVEINLVRWLVRDCRVLADVASLGRATRIG